MSAFRIVVSGVGGQGSVTAGRIIAEAAMADKKNVVTSEIHGMSQRGGIVESTVVIGDVKSPLIREGEADVLLSFEPAEALRSLKFASKKTVVVINTEKVVPFSVSMGQAEYPNINETLAVIEKETRKLVKLNAVGLARKAGSTMTLNSVLIGALSATGVLPISADILRETTLAMVPEKYLKENKKAYALGEKAAKKL